MQRRERKVPRFLPLIVYNSAGNPVIETEGRFGNRFAGGFQFAQANGEISSMAATKRRAIVARIEVVVEGERCVSAQVPFQFFHYEIMHNSLLS